MEKYRNERLKRIDERRRRENGVKWMGFDVMSLNDPFIEFMWIWVNNDDSIARSEANIGQLESMGSKYAAKRRSEKWFAVTFSWLDRSTQSNAWTESSETKIMEIEGRLGKRWSEMDFKMRIFHSIWFRSFQMEIH